MWGLSPANLNPSNYVNADSRPAAAEFTRKSAAWQGRRTLPPTSLGAVLRGAQVTSRAPVCVAHDVEGCPPW